MRNLVIAGVVIILALITLRTALYVVDETEQVVVTRFGDVQSVRTEPGLYFKAPFGVDTVISYDKRLLRI
ncbi:MAG: protease modulator HflC, partial [Dehalococcoidia bacterium]